MRNSKSKQQNRKNYLKKKLFVAGAYLFVSAVLLVLVSFAQYRMKINLDENKQQIAQISTVLELNPSLSSHSDATIDYTNYLNGLQPGQKAQTYAGDTTVNQKVRDDHKISVCVRGGKTANTSDAAVKFTLKIQGNSRIPLEFAMPVQTETGTKVFRSVPTVGDGYVEYRFEDDAQGEPIFSLLARDNNAVSLDIYVGWDSRIDDSGELERKLTAMDYRKEVELLTIRADILSSEKVEPQNKLTLKDDVNLGGGN